MRYPNKNIGRWEGNSAPPDEPEDIRCTHETWMGKDVGWEICLTLCPEWDGDEDPLCEEHSEDAQQMDKADNQRKAMAEDG